MNEQKWYGLMVDGVLMEVRKFSPDALPNLNDVESFRLWDVPYLRMCNYQVMEVGGMHVGPEVIQDCPSPG